MTPITVVLVEDNPGDVFLARKALAEMGIPHVMTHFETGEDAVESLCADDASNQPSPDLILMDLNTPRTDGFFALERIRSTPRLAAIPIAVLTSSQSPVDFARVERYGAKFISKPANLRKYLDAVISVVRELVPTTTDPG